MKQHLIRNLERGGVLILTLLLMLLLGGLAGSLFTVQLHRDRLKADYINRISATYNAEGALNYSVELLWNGFLASGGGEPGSLGELRSFLDQNGIVNVPRSTWVAVPLTRLRPSDGAGAGVQLFRTDGTDYTDLRFRSSVTIGSHTETVESVFRAEGKTFNGFNFALFSNNVSCTFCHAQIDNVKGADGGPYERVRVAALESLMVRDNAATTIAGTLYTMGKLLDKKGNVLSDLAGTTVDGYTFTNNTIDPQTTKLVDLYAAPTGADGKPLPGYNLYKDYPGDSQLQTDGKVPTDFPGVFPDENGNRLIDDEEFARSASTAGGTASGFGFVVPAGTTFGGSLSSTSPLSVNGVVEGNLILTGTASNPIRLDGKVVVNGDVIIQGVVQGTGSITARGNVYVTGDLVYNDGVVGGRRTFGVAPDGTANGLGLAAGGNVVVGDYLTPKGGSVTSPASLMTGTAGSGYGFAISQLSLFNRREWQKTQEHLPGAGGKMVKNSTYQPNYKPRYYVLDRSNPVYTFIKNSYWDDAKQTWIGPEHAGDFKDLTTVAPGPGAVISPLNPTNPWVTPSQLKQMWIADEADRPKGSPLKFDGLIYTDSSVFTLARGASKTAGQMVVNGALVASETGILAGKNLKLNYDQRVTDFLDIKESTAVEFSRLLKARRSPTITRS